MNIFLLVFFCLSCKERLINSDNDKNGGFEKICNYSYDKNGLKNGSYKCYYSKGSIYMIGMMRDDSLKINEEFIYYPTGHLKEYAFYNCLGERRYRRIYNELGDILKEYGDFYSHVNMETKNLFLGDSILLGDTVFLDFYIAVPPGTYYKLYGINDMGKKYEIKVNEDIPYMRKIQLCPIKTGNYIFPFEVEIFDTLRGKKEIRKDDVTLTVVSGDGRVP